MQNYKDLKEESKAVVSLAPITKHVCSVAVDFFCAAMHVACNMIHSALQRLSLADGCKQCSRSTARIVGKPMHTAARKSLGAYSVPGEVPTTYFGT